MNSKIEILLARLPGPMATVVCHVLSFGAGIVAALILHYVLYRIGLPGKPFIYVAF